MLPKHMSGLVIATVEASVNNQTLNHNWRFTVLVGWFPLFGYRLAMHGERNNRHKADDNVAEGAVPAYLLDREATARAKVGD